MTKREFCVKGEVASVDDDLGIVFGWGMVCKLDGEPYFDLQGDNASEEGMLKAIVDFMLHSQVGKEMHSGDQVAQIVLAFPMTEEVAKAFEVTTRKTGMMLGYKPSNDEVLEKFRSGEYTGFSIGGVRIKDEPVEDDEDEGDE